MNLFGIDIQHTFIWRERKITRKKWAAVKQTNVQFARLNTRCIYSDQMLWFHSVWYVLLYDFPWSFYGVFEQRKMLRIEETNTTGIESFVVNAWLFIRIYAIATIFHFVELAHRKLSESFFAQTTSHCCGLERMLKRTRTEGKKNWNVTVNKLRMVVQRC